MQDIIKDKISFIGLGKLGLVLSTLFAKNILRFSLDFITDLTIDKFVLNKSPVTVKAFVSFGKQDPP